jgi:hypothetical protein
MLSRAHQQPQAVLVLSITTVLPSVVLVLLVVFSMPAPTV